MRRETVLVTGGAGFIGSHLVERLLKEGYHVRVLDNFSTGRQANLAQVLDEIELYEADLRDDIAVKEAVTGSVYILHQAALGSVPRSIDDPLTTHECNSTGTLKLLLAARQTGVRRVVYASSSSVYGNTPTLPKHEMMSPTPLSPYALSKLTGEIYCQLFTSVYRLETVSLRYFNVFGPRQDSHSQYAAVIPRFIEALLSDRRPLIYGDGEQTRDFTYIDNVVEANLLAMTASGEVAGEVLNVAGGENHTVNELARTLSEALNIPLALEFTDSRAGDVQDSYADISKAIRLLNYRVNIGFQEGIARTAKWFREQQQ
ncbi:MAG: SDR family oxidoreductase [Acidobacteriota bacterium]